MSDPPYVLVWVLTRCLRGHVVDRDGTDHPNEHVGSKEEEVEGR